MHGLAFGIEDLEFIRLTGIFVRLGGSDIWELVLGLRGLACA